MPGLWLPFLCLSPLPQLPNTLFVRVNSAMKGSQMHQVRIYPHHLHIPTAAGIFLTVVSSDTKIAIAYGLWSWHPVRCWRQSSKQTSQPYSQDSQSGGKTDAKHTLNSVWTSAVTVSPTEAPVFPFHANIVKLGLKRTALFLWLYLAPSIFRTSSPAIS